MSHAGGVRRPGGGAGDRRVGDRETAAVVTSTADGILVLEVTGSFPAAAAAANEALLRTLFHQPEAVACDLSAVAGDLDDGTMRLLLDTGGYLEHWPGTRLALVTGDHRPRRRPDDSAGPDVLVGESLAEALAALAGVPTARTARLHLAADPRASRAARDFVSRTCLDWRLQHGIPSAVLVVSELVTNSLAHAGTDVDITLSAVGNKLRLAVQDGNDDPPRLVRAGSEQGRGRGMHVVEGFSRAWGSLPGPDGGKAVWVVIDA
jgi:anti-sigma regulatory factor (Ser/Thr protein kinase)